MNNEEVKYRKNDLFIGVLSIATLCLTTLLIYTYVFGVVSIDNTYTHVASTNTDTK